MALSEAAATAAADSGIAGGSEPTDTPDATDTPVAPTPTRKASRQAHVPASPPKRPAPAKADADDDPDAEAEPDDDPEAAEREPEGEPDEEAGEAEWSKEEAKKEREALDARKKKLDASHIALTKKSQKLARRAAEVEQRETRLKQETDAASRFFQESHQKIQAFDRIREMARESDPALIEMLGLDIEKLGLYVAQQGTGMEFDRKAKAIASTFESKLEAERKAREAAEQRFRDAQEGQQAVQQFVRMARRLDGCPLVGEVARADPDELVDEAMRLRERALARGEDLHGEKLLRRLERRFAKLAGRDSIVHNESARQTAPGTTSRAQPTGQRPPKPADRGLGNDPRRGAPEQSVDLSSLTPEQLDELAERKLAEMWRKH